MSVCMCFKQNHFFFSERFYYFYIFLDKKCVMKYHTHYIFCISVFLCVCVCMCVYACVCREWLFTKNYNSTAEDILKEVFGTTPKYILYICILCILCYYKYILY
eukprot:GHVR01124756.1.p2 GENE.GHVR01124756.1~~GHVR01124756.1.p2  ORF type:complete len:104 (+),score=23.61 GHVR01124756.1:787-1098(+)